MLFKADHVMITTHTNTGLSGNFTDNSNNQTNNAHINYYSVTLKKI